MSNPTNIQKTFDEIVDDFSDWGKGMSIGFVKGNSSQSEILKDFIKSMKEAKVRERRSDSIQDIVYETLDNDDD